MKFSKEKMTSTNDFISIPKKSKISESESNPWKIGV